MSPPNLELELKAGGHLYFVIGIVLTAAVIGLARNALCQDGGVDGRIVPRIYAVPMILGG